MERKSGIYMILNKANNKIYIGQSVDVNQRWKQHKADLRHKNHENKHLINSWHKYGEESFEFILLCECEESQLNTMEQYYIFCFDSSNSKIGYNKDYGGSSGRPTQYIKEKISNSLKGNSSWNKGLKTGHTPWNKSKKCPEKIKLKISKANKGNIASNRTKVICLNTKEIFDSIRQASNKYNLPSANIHKNLQSKIKSCGKDKNGQPLVWVYYNKYLTMTEEEINKLLKKPINCNTGENNPTSKKVICLDTLEVFNSMREAENKYNIWRGGVSESCKNNKRVGKIKYIFMKYDKYMRECLIP